MKRNEIIGKLQTSAVKITHWSSSFQTPRQMYRGAVARAGRVPVKNARDDTAEKCAKTQWNVRRQLNGQTFALSTGNLMK